MYYDELCIPRLWISQLCYFHLQCSGFIRKADNSIQLYKTYWLLLQDTGIMCFSGSYMSNIQNLTTIKIPDQIMLLCQIMIKYAMFKHYGKLFKINKSLMINLELLVIRHHSNLVSIDANNDSSQVNKLTLADLDQIARHEIVRLVQSGLTQQRRRLKQQYRLINAVKNICLKQQSYYSLGRLHRPIPRTFATRTKSA